MPLTPVAIAFLPLMCTYFMHLLARMDKALGRAVEGASAAGYNGSAPPIITHQDAL
jgi:hypothetical protein